MTAKDVLLLLRHRHQSPVARSKLKFLTFFDKKTYLDAEIFFGFLISEFINDNTFSLKIKKKRYRDFNTKLKITGKQAFLLTRHSGAYKFDQQVLLWPSTSLVTDPKRIKRKTKIQMPT